MLLAYVVFFLLVLRLGIFVEVDVDCRQNYYPPPLLFFSSSLHTILSLTQISARLKLVSVPFSSLLLDIGHLQKLFPGEHHESSEMGQSYYVSQSLHRPISYYILVSFG